ncbi:Sensory neuron membrane protein 2 [Diplonema papillatum]|nr:Sensory neuron membrane protein 2 [Diplonema papillatum]
MRCRGRNLHLLRVLYRFRMKCVKCSFGGLVFIALIMLILGIVLQFIIDGIVVKQAENMIPLKDTDSALYEMWVDHGGYGSPIYNYYYVWNITNVDGFYAGEKAKLEKIGPFVYRLFDWRENVSWSGADKEYISFTYHNYNVYLPERSTREWSLDDTATVPNIAIQGLLLQLQDALQPLEWDMAIAFIRKEMKLVGESLLITRPMRDIVFGYTDPVLESFKLFAEEFDIPLPEGFTSVVQLQAIDTPEFYASPSMQYSGTTGYKKTAEFITWCGKTNLSEYWPEDPEIKGTDGWNFPPHPDQDVYVFVDAIPAVLTLEKGESFKLLGIKSSKYYIADEIFSNTSDWGIAHFSEGPGGLINLTSVQSASVFLSLPYFLRADPYYQSRVDMPPADFERDSTWMAIEPITGASIAAQQVIQINLEMQPWLCEALRPKRDENKTICRFEHVVMPVMLANQYISIPPNEADALKDSIYGTPHMIKTVGWIMFGLSFGIFLWASGLFNHIRTHEPRAEWDDVEGVNGETPVYTRDTE